jgi:tetratricopeptide (TPR) repeat protein
MRPFVTLTFLLALSAGVPLAAQYVQPLPQMMPPGDADALAAQVRALAANPSDLNALIRAGELALKLEDATAAASFFARAERIDPRNGRVKAGLGELLVQAERPGEALRRFAEAESFGARVDTFAADRGLAYDLIGEQERAQRDYRLALKSGQNDETTRRYALSLGISGKREEALALLDPLLRKSDRGAWRARAFILAMSGNRVDAEQIATTMMPAGMSQGLQPFFDRLPTLSPVDRAFAVHFGETRPSAQRYADARMVPPLPPLGVDPDARALALAAQAREKPMRAAEAQVAKPAKRKRGRRDPVELAVQAAAPPVALALPAAPAYVDPAAAARSSAAPGATSYYVQNVPAARPPVSSYNPVAQANRAAAIAAAPTTPAFTPAPAPTFVPQPQPQPQSRFQPQPQAVQPYPSVQQRVSGRVMPLAPLQPTPLPSSAVAPTRAPAWYGTPGAVVRNDRTAQPAAPTATPPVETATRVQPTTPAAPVPYAVAPPATVPVETATRVETQSTAASPVTQTPVVARSLTGQPYAPTTPPVAAGTPIVPTPVKVASAATSGVPATAVQARVEDARPLPGISEVPLPAATVRATPVEPEVRYAPVVARVEPVRAAPVAVKAPARPVIEARHKLAADERAKSEAPDTIGRKTSGGKLSTSRNADAELAVEPKRATGRRSADKKDLDAAEPTAAEAPAGGKKAVVKKTGAKKSFEADPDDGADTTSPNAKKRGDRKTAAGRKGADADEAADTPTGTSKRGDRKAGGGKKTVDDDAADAKASDGKKRADRKNADGKKGAETKKKDAKSEEPSRVWVQVSGGANENDLPKQWNKLRSDQPGMFKGRSGYATPLRATNRILTGPFASEAEAQTYVNKLAKQGVSGFVFKSEPGQKVNKLPAK